MKVDALTNLVTTPSGGGPAPARAPVRAEPAVAVQEQAPPPGDSEQLGRVVDAMNRQIQTVAPNLQFSVDEDTGKTVVRIVDTDTGETIRQVPSEELLAISRSIDRFQGLLLDGEG
jgi:flagellar protein FlaG